jgi:hypothetical protein
MKEVERESRRLSLFTAVSLSPERKACGRAAEFLCTAVALDFLPVSEIVRARPRCGNSEGASCGDWGGVERPWRRSHGKTGISAALHAVGEFRTDSHA